MKYVIDSSVAFKWVIPEAHQDKANLLRDDFRNAIYELLAPEVFSAEVAHALTRAERQNRITIGQACALWLDVMATTPQLFPTTPLTVRAIEISSKLRVGVYDCLYVALAEQEQCPLVTADQKLLANLQPHFSFLVDLAALP